MKTQLIKKESVYKEILKGNKFFNTINYTNETKNLYFFYSILNKDIDLKTFTETQNRFKLDIKRLNNITYDLLNFNSNNLKPLSNNIKLLRFKDNNNYKHIDKKTTYKDLSLLNVLKILLKKHKISRLIYKDTLRRLKENKKLKSKVIEHLNQYYKVNSKYSKSKNTITALNNKVKYQYTYIKFTNELNNITFNIKVKRNTKYKIRYLENTNKTLNLLQLENNIIKEFKVKLKQDNNFF